MDAECYWSTGEGGWVPSRADAGLYWSVQRCRWEPVGAAADALATPWAMLRAEEVAVPGQRQQDVRSAPVET